MQREGKCKGGPTVDSVAQEAMLSNPKIEGEFRESPGTPALSRQAPGAGVGGEDKMKGYHK